LGREKLIDVMRIAWRDRVLKMLISERFISLNYASKLKKRYPKGFIPNGENMELINTVTDEKEMVRMRNKQGWKSAT
jgi:hypothetical protein